MDKIYNDIIDVFYGGRSQDLRIQKKELSAITQHFNIFTSPKRLTPYRAMEADETLSYKIANFLYANSRFYGLGAVAGQTYVQVYRKGTDAIADAWGTLTNQASGSGARSTRVFLAFHGYSFGLRNGDSIWAADLTGVAAFTEQACAISYAAGNEAQGIVTSDDLLLIPYGYKIAKKDGAGAGPTANWTAAALTLPSDMVISDIVEIDSNTVAVAAFPTSGVGTSKVYFWDKVNTDPYDYVDFGEGTLQLIALIDSELVGISNLGGSGVDTNTIFPRLSIRAWTGGKARLVLEVQADNATFQLYGNYTKIQDGSRIHFGLKMTLDGVAYLQLASVGRVMSGYPLAFTMAQKVDNDVTITSIEGVGKLGDYFWVAHNADGSVNRTQDADVYTSCTAVHITEKLNGERQNPALIRKLKKIVMCGIICAPLPDGGSISLYMRKDAETSWSLVRTYTTTNGMGFEAGTLDQTTFTSPATAEFGNAKEFQFKVTATGTGVNAKAEPVAIVYGFTDAGAEVED